MSDAQGAAMAALINGAFNLGGSYMSNKMGYHSARKLQQNQYNLNKNALREFYSNARYSLENAGYNPLLATSQSAQGFSASASANGPDMSGIGSEIVNSAIAVRQANQEVKKTKEETEGIKLDNKLKQKELDTSPKSVFSDYIRGNNNPVVNFVKQVGSKLGISSNSAESSLRNERRNIPVIKLHDGKGYVQKGVPKSVVKSFNQLSSAMSSKRFREMSDDKIRRYKPSKRRYNSPPREYPR